LLFYDHRELIACVKYLVNHIKKVIKEEQVPYFNLPLKDLRIHSYILGAPKRAGKMEQRPCCLKAKNKYFKYVFLLFFKGNF